MFHNGKLFAALLAVMLVVSLTVVPHAERVFDPC